MKNLKVEMLGLFLGALFVTLTGLSIIPTPGFWFSVNNIWVYGGASGAPLLLNYDRTIARPFVAEWRVEVRRFERGGWVSYCTTPTTRQTYSPAAILPDPVTLEWLAYTDRRCWNLPPGQYQLEVYYTLNPHDLMEREISTRSNVFEVR